MGGESRFLLGGEREQMSPQHLNVSHFDTDVLARRNLQCLAFDNLEGAVEDVRKAVLCQWFTSVAEKDTTNQSIHQLNIGLRLLNVVIYIRFNSQ